MENKKKMIILSLFAVILFVIVAVIFLWISSSNKVKYNDNNSIEKKQVIDDDCKKVSGDIEFFDLAMNDGVKYCDCIQDDTFKQVCVVQKNNNEVYNKALNERDGELCSVIKNETEKKNCFKNIKAQEEYLNKLFEEERLKMEELSVNKDISEIHYDEDEK